MAVIDAYMGGSTLRTEDRGGDLVTIVKNFETTAADLATSKYRLGKLSGNLVPVSIEINNDAIAGATDMDLGLYDTLENGGAVKDADCFMDGADISAGNDLGSEQNGLATLPVDEIGDMIYEQAGDDNAVPKMEYDLVLTSNADITGAGTISIRAIFAKTA